jgi:hypothetical protein
MKGQLQVTILGETKPELVFAHNDFFKELKPFLDNPISSNLTSLLLMVPQNSPIKEGCEDVTHLLHLVFGTVSTALAVSKYLTVIDPELVKSLARVDQLREEMDKKQLKLETLEQQLAEARSRATSLETLNAKLEQELLTAAPSHDMDLSDLDEGLKKLGEEETDRLTKMLEEKTLEHDKVKKYADELSSKMLEAEMSIKKLQDRTDQLKEETKQKVT